MLALLGLGADRWAADRERDRLADAAAAGEQVVAGKQRLAGVRAVEVLPWHDELAQARDAYAARLQEVSDLLAAVARAPAEPAGAPGRTAELRDSAVAALQAAGVELPG